MRNKSPISIRQLEKQLSSILVKLKQMLQGANDQAKFNADDLLAVLQGITGYIGGLNDKDPFTFIDAAVSLAQSKSGKQCLGFLHLNLSSIKKWMTFGKNYKPLLDSGDLDFDKMDVASVPEIMQANLEINKQGLAKGLVCLLDVASRPKDIAEFKQVMESFFIAGAARIDLIANVMDLDNDIEGYSFDIELLKETQKKIVDIKELRLVFVDELLSTYRELDRSFMRNTDELHKAYKFRTLWPLRKSDEFRKLSELERRPGQSYGQEQLKVLQTIKGDKRIAETCLNTTTYSRNIKRWRFNKENDTLMFEQLAKGYTIFSLNIEKSCKKCYNMRLIKIYIELYGFESQPANVSDNIHLQIRHLSSSYFRAGDNTIKQYRQHVGSYRKIKFDRFNITNEETCNRKKEAGLDKKCPFLCLPEDDSRWQPMCNHPLNAGGSSSQESMLGMEECKSPFGTYELKIPVDKNLTCDSSGVVNTNCKDLDVSYKLHNQP
ncbi:uncharacterized protein LOC144630770 [Oculina patagonica]